ncbi:unnamed protein product [Sphacelaria rigidula]
MVDVKSMRCGEVGCSTRPSYGVAGSGKVEFCATHARAGMVSVRNKRCGEVGYSTWPSYGVAGSGKARFCDTHARAGIVDVKTKRSGEVGCFTLPSFGVAGSGKAELCATNVLAGMIDVKSKRRGEVGCFTRPSFGAAGSGEAEFCATHARARVVRARATTRGKEGSNKASHSSGAGRNASDGGRSVEMHRSSRTSRGRRGGIDSTISPPAATRQPVSAAAADGASPNRAVRCMEMKMEMTLHVTRVPEAIASNELASAQSTVHCSVSDGNSSSIKDASCGSGIASGRRSAKRLRRVAPVNVAFRVATAANVMSVQEGDDVKSELGVSAPDGHVSAVISIERKK